MAILLAPPRPASKSRRIHVLSRDPHGLAVRIQCGRDVATYRVERVDSDFGRGFSVAKLALADELGVEYETPYDVHIDPDGNHSCECKGFLRWRHCKHVEGLLALIRTGKL